MQIPENIKLISAYNIGQLLHKKKVCPIDLVYFYYNEIRDFKENSPYTILTKKRAIIENPTEASPDTNEQFFMHESEI